MNRDSREVKMQKAYTFIYLDYVSYLKNFGVEVEKINQETIMNWMDNYLKNIEKHHTPMKVALFNKKIMGVRD